MNSSEFIEAALFCASHFTLSYPDSKQKWLIRKHLLALLHSFPTFSPSIDTFIHDDGTAVNLLTASGHLHISSSSPQIPLTIWIHESYPYMAPMVFVKCQVYRDHPFVEPSGATVSAYMRTWEHPRCNLNDLVHNLVKIFSIDHPFFSAVPSSNPSHPSSVSRLEALDRLSGSIHYDFIAITAKSEEEIEELSNLQGEMMKRVDIATSGIIELQIEKMGLEKRLTKLAEDADMLINWLKVYDNNNKERLAKSGADVEDAFEFIDEKARLEADCLAADLCVEDTIDALDKAVGSGAVSFDAYIRQVRSLAREQFFHRATLNKLKQTRTGERLVSSSLAPSRTRMAKTES